MRSSTSAAASIVVLGHPRCGAVATAVDRATAPGDVVAIVSDIKPAVEAVQGQPGEALANAIKSNVDRVAKRIEERSELGALASTIRVVEAYYDLDSGKIIWLDQPAVANKN